MIAIAVKRRYREMRCPTEENDLLATNAVLSIRIRPILTMNRPSLSAGVAEPGAAPMS